MLYKKFVRFIYNRLKRDSGSLPKRKGYFLNESVVHESVDIRGLNLGKRNVINADCIFFGRVELGNFTTIGSSGLFHGGLIKIGSYCQLGPFVSIYAIEHQQDTLTIFNAKALLNGDLKSLSVEKEVNVGHGVWIGHGAVILKGVTIGNGAIIGANAVVTKDVEAYSIVGGNPARFIRFRFKDSEKLKVEQSKWWEKSPEQLETTREVLFKKVADLNTEEIERIREM